MSTTQPPLEGEGNSPQFEPDAPASPIPQPSPEVERVASDENPFPRIRLFRRGTR